MKRRTVLKTIAGGVLVEHIDAAQSAPPSKLQFFTPEQNLLVDRLAEMIIPADERSPGAHEAKVSLFIDLMLANSKPAVQKFWTSALRTVDEEATRRYRTAFAKCNPTQQDQVLAWMAARETNPQTEPERFFVELKTMVINGYYTSATGIHRELHYQGNRPMHEFIGCTHPEHG